MTDRAKENEMIVNSILDAMAPHGTFDSNLLIVQREALEALSVKDKQIEGLEAEKKLWSHTAQFRRVELQQEEIAKLTQALKEAEEAINLAKQYPRPTSPCQSVTAVYKTPATSLREAADFEDAKERAWIKIEETLQKIKEVGE